MIYNLVIGDSGQDGHRVTKSVRVSINLTKEQINQSLKRGLEILGWNNPRQLPDIGLCENYGENWLDVEQVEALVNTGFDRYKIEDQDTQPSIYVKDYIAIWLHILTIGAKAESLTLEALIIKNDETLDIGGYGLFE